jgi:hypothetical protein
LNKSNGNSRRLAPVERRTRPLAEHRAVDYFQRVNLYNAFEMLLPVDDNIKNTKHAHLMEAVAPFVRKQTGEPDVNHPRNRKFFADATLNSQCRAKKCCKSSAPCNANAEGSGVIILAENRS